MPSPCETELGDICTPGPGMEIGKENNQKCFQFLKLWAGIMKRCQECQHIFLLCQLNFQVQLVVFLDT